MAVKLLKVGGVYNTPVKEYIANSKTELDNVEHFFGDRAYVTTEGAWYVYDGSNWVQEGEATSSTK